MSWTRLQARLPEPVQELLTAAMPAVQIVLIVVLSVVLRQLLRRLVARTTQHYNLPLEFKLLANRIATFLIFGTAGLWILERLGVSGAVLWSAFTGFAAVAAVAFFAAWSVLSNIFCSLLVYTTRLFRLHDHIELLENGEKPGLKGRVIDINLIYTTLAETGDGTRGTELKVPNSLFFQRTIRRWHGPLEQGGHLPPKPYAEPEAASATTPATPTPATTTATVAGAPASPAQ